jgi:hypothetical protein
MSDKFMELDRALDEESWDWLNDNCPPLAISVQKAVEKDISAEEIKRRVIDRLGAHRLPLAQRCEAGARYLHATKQRA